MANGALVADSLSESMMTCIAWKKSSLCYPCTCNGVPHSVVSTFLPTPFFPNASSRLVIVPDADRMPLRSFDR